MTDNKTTEEVPFRQEQDGLVFTDATAFGVYSALKGNVTDEALRKSMSAFGDGFFKNSLSDTRARPSLLTEDIMTKWSKTNGYLAWRKAVETIIRCADEARDEYGLDSIQLGEAMVIDNAARGVKFNGAVQTALDDFGTDFEAGMSIAVPPMPAKEADEDNEAEYLVSVWGEFRASLEYLKDYTSARQTEAETAGHLANFLAGEFPADAALAPSLAGSAELLVGEFRLGTKAPAKKKGKSGTTVTRQGQTTTVNVVFSDGTSVIGTYDSQAAAGQAMIDVWPAQYESLLSKSDKKWTGEVVAEMESRSTNKWKDVITSYQFS